MVFTDFHGLDVPGVTALRQALREDGIDYMVVKKTLLERALQDAGYEASGRLAGEIGIVIGYEDPILAARDAYHFAKKHKETFKVLGGIFEKQEVDASKILSLAIIPSREVLLGQLLQALNGPIGGFVRVLGGLERRFVYALEQIKKKRSTP